MSSQDGEQSENSEPALPVDSQVEAEKTGRGGISKKGALAIVAAAAAVIAPSHVLPLFKRLGKKISSKKKMRRLKEALARHARGRGAKGDGDGSVGADDGINARDAK